MLVRFHPLQTFSTPTMSSSTPDIYRHLLRLPRELRDLIYPDIVKQGDPIRLGYAEPHAITNPFHSNSMVAAEALEAFYKCNSFIISFDDDPKARPVARQHWKYHPFFPVIRHLIIEATESVINPEQANLEHFESLYWDSLARKNWTSLLSLDHLQTLEVRLEKRNDRNVSTFDFGPVLRELEHRASPPDIRVLTSLDRMLARLRDQMLQAAARVHLSLTESSNSTTTHIRLPLTRDLE
ncbi:hypothetical protein BDV96DRAFT_205091 [Lophiotrema nucula]|uniref:Uncharacterized protein n=1 Tax=Lophiotrema nucula TaxID=690887 RepID=A0A6A5ZQM7_9PLEO|nr:hypothetical protein BDV96DRAFT_205091 [Lophiotrema nucula]